MTQLTCVIDKSSHRLIYSEWTCVRALAVPKTPVSKKARSTLASTMKALNLTRRILLRVQITFESPKALKSCQTIDSPPVRSKMPTMTKAGPAWAHPSQPPNTCLKTSRTLEVFWRGRYPWTSMTQWSDWVVSLHCLLMRMAQVLER